MRKIVIEIDEATGESSMDAIGFQGPDCALKMQKLLKTIGGKQLSARKKPEFDKKIKQKQKVKA
tara:strand:- start:10465 stop:10656 length:192 start_codon:yes stop_codon:yes gene_type:complete